MYKLTVYAEGRGHSVTMEVTALKSEEHIQWQSEAGGGG